MKEKMDSTQKEANKFWSGYDQIWQERDQMKWDMEREMEILRQSFINEKKKMEDELMAKDESILALK